MVVRVALLKRLATQLTALEILNAHANSPLSQLLASDYSQPMNSLLRQDRWTDWHQSLTPSSTKSARPTAASALRHSTPPLLFRQRIEPSPSREPSQSSRESTSPREKELPRSLRAVPRRTPCALPRTTNNLLVEDPSASAFKCAHPSNLAASSEHLADQPGIRPNYYSQQYLSTTSLNQTTA